MRPSPIILATCYPFGKTFFTTTYLLAMWRKGNTSKESPVIAHSPLKKDASLDKQQ